MSEDMRRRNAIIISLKNLTLRVEKLESRLSKLDANNGGGWEIWARQLIVALISALLAVMGYKALGI